MVRSSEIAAWPIYEYEALHRFKRRKHRRRLAAAVAPEHHAAGDGVEGMAESSDFDARISGPQMCAVLSICVG